MRAKSSKPKASAERVVKDIRRATRRHFSAEDKIRILLEDPQPVLDDLLDQTR
jgi:transposase